MTRPAMPPRLVRGVRPPYRDIQLLKLLVLVNGGVPGALLAWDAWHGNLGANPVNFAIRTTGLLGLILLTMSLAVTPLRQVTRIGELIASRRTLGLWGFWYILTHFVIYFWWDRQHSVKSTWDEIFNRDSCKIYLTIGMSALLAMIPLVVTSTDAMISRLGPVKWKHLHSLVYLIVPAGVVHYYLLQKSDKRQPLWFGGVVAFLLLWRWALPFFERTRPMPVRRAAAPSPAAAGKARFWKGRLRVASIIAESPDVRTFRLVPTDGADLPFTYLPGQYLNVALPVDGKTLRRSYSISSSPTCTAYCEITTKRDPKGTVSPHMHDHFGVGGELDVSAPAGKLTFTGTEMGASGIVLIGAGVGITPLMSVIRYLTDHAWPRPIDLIYLARREPDLVFRQELEALAGRHGNLKLHLALTDPPDGWPHHHGRVGEGLLAQVDYSGRIVHLCGPDGMMQATRELLVRRGVPDDRIKQESFLSPPVPTETDPTPAATPTRTPPEADGAASITFARSGQTLNLDPGTTILEAAESVGVQIPYDCRSGICGQCKTRLAAGRVDMPVQDALTKADRAAGVVLACQAIPAGAVTVDA